MSSSNQPSGDKQRKEITISKKPNNNNISTTPKTPSSVSTTPNATPKTPPNTTPTTTKNGISITKPTPKVEKPSKERSKESLFDGIPTRTIQKQDKPVVQEKPTGVTITKRTKKKIEFQLSTTKYQIEEAYQFRDTVLKYLSKMENKRISDEQFIKMASLLNRFKLTQQRKPNNAGAKAKNRTDYEKQEHKINTELNKLSMDNFMGIIDNLTIKEDNFLDFHYLKLLAKSISSRASEQPLYSSLYSLSATSISSVLDNPEYANSRKAFCETLIQESQKSVEDAIATESKFASVNAIGSASFIGYLTNREFIPIDLCFSLVQKAVNNISTSNIEICRQILIPAGEKIEEKYPEEFKEIISKLEAATKDKKNIPGSIRYPLIDLLEARKNNWNTKPLMHIITSTKANKKNSNKVDNKPLPSKEDTQNVIKVGVNQFASLLDSDDDDNEIYDDNNDNDNDNYDDGTDFDGDDMIRRYVIDNEISSTWNRSHVGDLLFAIALRPNKEISKAMKLLQILNDENNFATNEAEEQNVFNAICETVKKCNADEVSDSENYKHAIDNCGTIFARLVYFGISSVDQFGKVFPIESFRITVVLCFLSEMIKLKKIQLVEESQYWTNYEWRPEGYSNLKITNSIAELPEPNSTTIFRIFPLFDCLWTLQDDIDFMASPHEDDENFDLASEIDNFPPDVIADPAFATGALEIIFKANICFDIVLPFLDQNKLTVLQWVEKYGIREIRDTKEIVKLIENVYNSGNYNKADMQPFYELKGDEKHQEIVQNLKNVI